MNDVLFQIALGPVYSYVDGAAPLLGKKSYRVEATDWQSQCWTPAGPLDSSETHRMDEDARGTRLAERPKYA